jgi:hypothetical protein
MINAFHPKYIETHHPEFVKQGRTYSDKVVSGTANGRKARDTRESVSGKRALTTFPQTKAKK